MNKRYVVSLQTDPMCVPFSVFESRHIHKAVKVALLVYHMAYWFSIKPVNSKDRFMIIRVFDDDDYNNSILKLNVADGPLYKKDESLNEWKK